MSGAHKNENVEGPRIQGQFKGATTDIDRRHGDPESGGLSSGEKAAATRAERYGDELQFVKDNPEKAEAVEEFKRTEMGKATPQNADAKADDDLSNPLNKSRQSSF